MPKTVACVIARTVSTRLPLKIFRHVTGNISMLEFIISRLKLVKKIDEIFVCTSREPVDEIMEDIAKENNVKIYRGSPDEVIERMLSVGKITGANNLIRITADNLFTSYEYVDRQIELMNNHNLDYIRIPDIPLGATAEVMRTDALQRCYNMMDPAVSEYLMLFMFEPKNFKCGVLKVFEEEFADINLSVDYPHDLVRTKTILENYYNPNKLEIKLFEIIEIIRKNNIPDSIFRPSETIKLPYGKEVSYSEFKEDMRRRVYQSEIFH